MTFRRVLTEGQVDELQLRFFKGGHHDEQLAPLFESFRTQRRVLQKLFDRYHKRAHRRYSIALPIHNSELAYLKEIVNMDDKEE